VIGRHDFNSDWCAQEAGIVQDAAFFSLSAAEQVELLKPWAWVEARQEGQLSSPALRGAGFIHVDTQMPFRIGLARLEGSPSLERAEVRFADEHPFNIESSELSDFAHERFSVLPGVEMSDLNRRYGLWSAQLLAADPGHCMQVLVGGEVQGWFLGRQTDKGLELTLAMLKREASISGHLLYHKALVALGGRGARVGYAAFSVSNTPVLNIYAALGARFLAPKSSWLWIAK
jgi:hypothetical protein